MTDPSTTYHHTQLGFIILGAWAVGMVIVALGFRSIANASPPGAERKSILGLLSVVAVGVSIVAFLFSSLTIDVRDAELRWHFTAGAIHGHVPLRDVEEVSQLRHPAAYGWGLRRTPDGILYRVSGLNAVRIRMRDGRVFNFGSDEPTRLAQAIEEAMAAR